MTDVRNTIYEALLEFQCRHTVQDDEGLDGMPLLDMLTPKGDKDVGRGFEELNKLADHIADALATSGVVEARHQTFSSSDADDSGS